ncbi:hypothetical protein Tco_0728171 [Tanacetum coccineum]|uniref:Uncharacterized protein n=1 Tax=Tanacetum coccineum TaxID=301880 RepID=A0ABQ4YLA0_9ASTR
MIMTLSEFHVMSSPLVVTTFKDQHLKSINTILTNLQTVQEAVKEDHALNAKVLEATDKFIKNSSNLTYLNTHMKEVIKTYQHSFTNLLNLLEMLREANDPDIMYTLDAIQNTINTKANHHVTLDESYKSLSWNISHRLTKIKDYKDLIKTNIATLKADTFDIKITYDELEAHLDIKEQMEKAAKDAELSKLLFVEKPFKQNSHF